MFYGTRNKSVGREVRCGEQKIKDVAKKNRKSITVYLLWYVTKVRV